MKNFRQFSTEVMSVATRKKMARRMAKMAKSPVIQKKKKRAALRMRNPAKLAVLAKKKTRDTIRNKFYPGYKDMSMPEKVKIDSIIQQKYGKKIDKISKKVAKKLQKLEIEKVKKATAAMKREAEKNA